MTISWLSPFICRVHNDPWGEFGHWCPMCRELHVIAVAQPNPSKARWTFDGNLMRPTFSPSINECTGPFPDGRIEVCHYFLRAGVIEYCGDCTHEGRGQHIPLPPIPERWSSFSPPYRDPEGA